MCRILGEFSFLGEITDAKEFAQLNQLSKAGGPDSTGFWHDAHVQLGFNRLAILDVTENGNQPLVSPSGRYVVVFNGEIYNYKALQFKYHIAGGSLRSGSDTEVLAHLVEQIPVSQIASELDGMFAIAIWDTKALKMHLIRDFAGIKPLHYALNNKGLVFASQYNQIARHRWFQSERIQPGVLAAYLQRHYVPFPNGLLSNTHQLQPGERLEVDLDGTVRAHRYWVMPRFEQASIHQHDKALDWIRSSLDRAVQDQLMADVPLGAFLSGGVDSPLVCRYAQAHHPGRLKTFTIGSDSKLHDESEDAMRFARALSSESVLEQMNSTSAAAILSEVMGCLTEPFADFSIIPTYLVSKLARKGVTVALSGDGGDELFMGYERFWSVAKNIQFQHLPYPLKYLMYGADRVWNKNSRLNAAILASAQGEAHARLHSRTLPDAFHRVAPDLKPVNHWPYPEYDYPVVRNEEELIQQMRYSEFYDMMQKTLRKVDMASMGNSLEVRVPFLQKSFIEASLKVDYRLSYGPNQRKKLLKDLLQVEFPGISMNQSKRGFTVPLRQWIAQDLKPAFYQVLTDRPLLNTFGFSIDGVERLLDEHTQMKVDHKWFLFTLYTLFQWQNSIKP